MKHVISAEPWKPLGHRIGCLVCVSQKARLAGFLCHQISTASDVNLGRGGHSTRLVHRADLEAEGRVVPSGPRGPQTVPGERAALARLPCVSKHRAGWGDSSVCSDGRPGHSTPELARTARNVVTPYMEAANTRLSKRSLQCNCGKTLCVAFPGLAPGPHRATPR